MIYLDRQSKIPLYSQIYDQIKRDILNGNLKEEELLIGSRAFADVLGVSRNTVNTAYSQLIAEGYVVSVKGTGLRVRQVPSLAIKKESIKKSSPASINHEKTNSKIVYDLTNSSQTSDLFPKKLWKRYTVECLDFLTDESKLASYQEKQGELYLRKNLLTYLRKIRGVHCEERQIVITCGLQQSLDYLCKLIYLGIFVGLLAGQTPTQIFSLAFTAAVCLELFSLIGAWFIAAVEPLSQGITDFANKRLKGRTINIGLDWPFLAGRAEIWAAANVLAPIMLLEAIILPGNKLLPLGGIIAMGVTPALLVVTRGKLIRMIVIGAIELPLFLWSGTLIAPFVTQTAKAVGAFPAGLSGSAMISHTTMEGPIEKFLGYLVGNASQGQIEFVIYAALALGAYLLIFIWYARQMKKRNAAYAAEKEENASPATAHNRL